MFRQETLLILCCLFLQFFFMNCGGVGIFDPLEARPVGDLHSSTSRDLKPASPKAVSKDRLTDVPYSSVVRMEFAFGAGEYSCSGTLIEGADGDTYLLTATHCLFDPHSKNWLNEVVICVAAYSRTGCKGGRFVRPIEYVSIFTNAQRSEDTYPVPPNHRPEMEVYDQAIVKLKQSPQARALRPLFGLNLDQPQIRMLGYPDGDDFHAGTMYEIQTNLVFAIDEERQALLSQPAFAEGASGGPWIYRDSKGAHRVVGLLSSGIPGEGETYEISGIFGDNQELLYECATGGQGAPCKPQRRGDGKITQMNDYTIQETGYSVGGSMIYLQNGSMAVLAVRRAQRACTGKSYSGSGVELSFLRIDDMPATMQRQCFDLGRWSGRDASDMLVARLEAADASENYYLITANGTNDNRIRLHTFAIQDTGLVPLEEKIWDAGEIDKNVRLLQTANGFAFLRRRKGKLYLKSWDLSLEGKLKEGKPKALTGPKTTAFDAIALTAPAPPEIGSSFIKPQVLVAAVIGGKIELLSYLLHDGTWVNGPQLKTGIVAEEAPRLVQMDNGMIALGFLGKDRQAAFELLRVDYRTWNAGHYFLERVEDSRTNVVRGSKVLQGPGLADLGNGILGVAVALTDRTLLNTFAIPAHSVPSPRKLGEANMPAWNESNITPLYFGSPARPEATTIAVVYFDKSSGSTDFRLRTLSVEGASGVRMDTISYHYMYR